MCPARKGWAHCRAERSAAACSAGRRSWRLSESQVGIADGGASVGAAAGVVATEGEDAVGLVGVADVELVVGQLAAEDDLMATAQQRYVVVEGYGVVVEVRNGVGAAAHGELVGHREIEAVRHGLVHGD